MRGRRMVDRGGEHVGLEHHPRAAARGRIVDGAVLVGREIADLDRRAMPCPTFEREPRHAVPPRTGAHVGTEGERNSGDDPWARPPDIQISKRSGREQGWKFMRTLEGTS